MFSSCMKYFSFIKQNIDRVVNTLYQFMDPENKGKECSHFYSAVTR